MAGWVRTQPASLPPDSYVGWLASITLKNEYVLGTLGVAALYKLFISHLWQKGYASHCTSSEPLTMLAGKRRRSASLTRGALRGGSDLRSSYRHMSHASRNAAFPSVAPAPSSGIVCRKNSPPYRNAWPRVSLVCVSRNSRSSARIVIPVDLQSSRPRA